MVSANKIKFSMVEPYYLLIEQPKKLATHLDSLEGKVVGALWNSKAEGDGTLNEIMTVLKEQYGVKETRFFRKPSASGPAKPKQLDEIAGQVDAFVTGIGD
jgi:hypothetical protein